VTQGGVCRAMGFGVAVAANSSEAIRQHCVLKVTVKEEGEAGYFKLQKAPMPESAHVRSFGARLLLGHRGVGESLWLRMVLQPLK